MIIQYLPLVALALIAYIAVLKGSMVGTTVPLRSEQPQRHERGSAARGLPIGGELPFILMFLAGALAIIIIR
jgi:hypothetical protein